MTIDATDAQTRLVKELLQGPARVITVAGRTPYDLVQYPGAAVHICTYGILEPTLRALVDGLAGARQFSGRLPVAIPGLYVRGHSSKS
jgi:beta-N-acetylhexosaminidase